MKKLIAAGRIVKRKGRTSYAVRSEENGQTIVFSDGVDAITYTAKADAEGK